MKKSASGYLPQKSAEPQDLPERSGFRVGLGLTRFWVKVHTSGGQDTVVALCDEHLLGKCLKTGDNFEVTIDRSFYGGALIEEDDVFKNLKRGTIVNLFGNRVVEKAAQLGLVNPKAAIKIGGELHVQIVHITNIDRQVR